MRNDIFRFEGELEEDDIAAFVNQHRINQQPRLQRLKKYYLGEHDILHRKYEKGKPEARIVHNFPDYITDQATGYFMGTPVSYTSEDEEALERVLEILEYGDEADINAIHAEQMSIYGISYELLYIDKDDVVDTKFHPISPEEMFVIYDYDIEPNIIAAVRYYYHDVNDLRVELYDRKNITYFNGDDYVLKLQNSTEHFFGDVPVAVFINNNERQGDFEPVLTLVDEYNKLNSDTANDFEYFSDAYLFLSGATIEDEEAMNMKENRIINIDDPQAKAAFLTKNIQDTALENYKNRIVNDIHKFSAVPNLTDEAFAGNLSGVAIKYKILGLENQANMKERKFKKGLQRRFELFFNLFYTRGLLASSNYLTIKPVFKRTLPPNLMEEAEMARNLQGIVSTETLLSNLSFIEDAKAEMEQIEVEREGANAFIDDAYTTKALLDLEGEDVEVADKDG